jgi:hypothetical protein
MGFRQRRRKKCADIEVNDGTADLFHPFVNIIDAGCVRIAAADADEMQNRPYFSLVFDQGRSPRMRHFSIARAK